MSENFANEKKHMFKESYKREFHSTRNYSRRLFSAFWGFIAQLLNSHTLNICELPRGNNDFALFKRGPILLFKLKQPHQKEEELSGLLLLFTLGQRYLNGKQHSTFSNSKGEEEDYYAAPLARH